VTTAACFSASRVFFLPFVIFRGTRYREIYKQNLNFGMTIEVISMNTFFSNGLAFSKAPFFRETSTNLDGHVSHPFLKCLD
jgi:hypothetical protein